MIPRADIAEWREHVHWKNDNQVEQDLILSRVLVQLFNNPVISEKLLFRGGTALHKLFLTPPARYSEDIDLVQKEAAAIGDIMGIMRKIMNPFLGKPKTKQKKGNVMFVYKVNSETAPFVPLRVKVEINTREHFNVYGLIKKKFNIKSRWFSGECKIGTYSLEELLATKLRALYQRSKGRDLFDLWYGLKYGKADELKIISAFKKYMDFDGLSITPDLFRKNLEEKLKDPGFLNDTVLILHPDFKYNPGNAYESVLTGIIDSI